MNVQHRSALSMMIFSVMIVIAALLRENLIVGVAGLIFLAYSTAGFLHDDLKS